jgi:hypothetical protein
VTRPGLDEAQEGGELSVDGTEARPQVAVVGELEVDREGQGRLVGGHNVEELCAWATPEAHREKK